MSPPTRRDWFGLSAFGLGPELARPQTHLYLLEKVDSTSDFLLGRGQVATGRLCRWRGWGWQAQPLAEHPPLLEPNPGTLVVARRQTRGRGRQGRRWHDCGGLFLSWIWPWSTSALPPGLAVWAGLMIALALGQKYGLDVQLKWPNDLIVGNKKLGGLLVDRVGPGAAGLFVLGLGLNLTTQQVDLPVELQGRATSLGMLLDQPPRPAEVASIILNRLGAEGSAFTSEGWGAYQDDLRRCDWLHNRDVTMLVGQDEIHGRVQGIGLGGSLVVTTPEGEILHLQGGDVHVTDASSTRRDG